ncbi:MAG: HAD family hydrolase [Oscillospiraceae bacterium]|jgi:Cof subfamily protein (haloacid dehalogenase superfamily)|nr:HAD family hydrolase [Oscillospiraceae bacterium]
MKTLYVSDLDGTLLNDSAELSEYTRKTLNRLTASGLNFTIATARTAYTVPTVLEGLDLRLPAILNNGVMLFDLAARTFSNVKYIHPTAVNAALSAIRRYNLTALLYSADGAEQAVYYEPALENAAMKEFREVRFTRYGKKFTPVDRLETLSSDRVFYLSLLDAYPRLAPLYEEIRHPGTLSSAFYRNTYTENSWLLEIFSAEASKANAALELKKLGGFDRITAFGDNLNDLPLFGAADECLAVANAQEAVRAAADYVIDANTSDGVARWLEKFFQNQH